MRSFVRTVEQGGHAAKLSLEHPHGEDFYLEVLIDSDM